MMTPRRTLIVLSLAAFLPIAPAAAQSGVIIDDDSPTGKEYAIPLDQARREAAGQSGGGSASSSSAPLFGAGVGDGTQEKGAHPKSPKRDPQGSNHRPATKDASVHAGRTAAATVPEGGAGSLITIAAVAASVLLLGGVIGSIARRRTTPA